MKKIVSCTVRVLIFLAIQVLAFQIVAEATNGAKPPKRPKPEKGNAWYVMVLWEPGTPIPGSTEHVKKIKEPDLDKLKGKLLRSKDNTRFIELPVAAARELRKHEAVATLQRVWAGEPLEELSEDPYPSRSRSGLETESDTDLDWGPKDYTYDKSGHITGIGADNYSYDTAGRLIQATVGGKTETFKYDEFGNLVEKAVAGANPEVIPVDGSSNRLIGESYDAAGNMMAPKARSSDHGTLYTYDSFNMLTTTRSGRNLLYDADDELVGVVSGNTHSRWMMRDLEGRLIREYTANTEFDQVWFWQRDYVYADGALVGGETVEWSAVQPGGGTVMGGKRHYHLDHLGSVRMVTDGEGRSVSEHDYYPFGVTPTKAFQEELSPEPSIDSMRFAGHQRDFLGWLNIENRDYLDYMHARHYDPNLGRFLSVDPGDDVDPSKPQSWNKYSYVRNNPVNATDPTGMFMSKWYGETVVAANTIVFSSWGWYFAGMSVAHQMDKWWQSVREKDAQFNSELADLSRQMGGKCDSDAECAELLWSISGFYGVVGGGGAAAGALPEVSAVMRTPSLLAALNTAQLRLFVFRLQQSGWRIGTLGKGSHKGMGMVLRETDATGKLTGRMIQYHPGGGHHGAGAYWKVSSAVNGTIRYGASGGW